MGKSVNLDVYHTYIIYIHTDEFKCKYIITYYIICVHTTHFNLEFVPRRTDVVVPRIDVTRVTISTQDL